VCVVDGDATLRQTLFRVFAGTRWLMNWQAVHGMARCCVGLWWPIQPVINMTQHPT